MFEGGDFSNILNLISLLSQGAVTSIEIFILTLLFALPLGLLIALGRLSNKKWIRGPIKQYISVIRGTPLILQIFFVYFGPYYIFDLNLDRFVAAVLAFSLNYAAYFSEIFRGGIESIPRGQYEAASVLGFTRGQAFFRIILPQVIKRILPPMSNEVITLVKDTALVTVIGVSELFRMASNETSRQFSTTPLIVAGVFYYVMNLVVEKAFHMLENKLGYYR